MRGTPLQQWDQVLKGEGRRGPSIRKRLTANRHRNWLIALAAHSSAKDGQGKKLSDLERHMVQILQRAGGKVDLVGGFAHMESATPAALKTELFPTGFDRLTAEDTFTFADLGDMSANITKDTLAAPNVIDLDIEGIHAGRVHLRDQVKGVSREVRATHAGSMLRAVSPEALVAEAVAPLANRFFIKAMGFRCLEESNELSASDEPYWMFASTAPGFHAAWGSHVFADVDQNEYYNFEANVGCFWGMDCQPRTLPTGEIGGLATLMEHDEGNVDDVRNAWFVAIGGIGAILGASGVAAWVAAVVVAIGGFVGLIMEWMNDDHIADYAFTWDLKTANQVIDKHGGLYDLKPEIGDGDALYRLWIQVNRMV